MNFDNLLAGLPQIRAFSFSGDEISIVMAVLGLIICAVCGIYSSWYFKQSGQTRYAHVLIFIFYVSAFLALFASEWLTYLIFLEATVLCIYGLINLTNPVIAKRYLLAQLAAAAIILIGIAAQFSSIGTIGFAAVEPAIRIFFIIGLGIKTSMLGLHFWLPEAHSEASAPVSALLSGFAVKLGAYGLMRIILVPVESLIYLGAAMAIYGAMHCIISKDIKRILAYSTVSQLGLIIAAIATGPQGSRIALLHICLHGIFKAGLFLYAGFMERQNSSRDIEIVGNGLSSHPTMVFAFSICAISLAGLPPIATLYSKSFIKQISTVSANSNLVAILIMIASAGTGAYVFKVARTFYYTSSQKAGIKALQIGWQIRIAALALPGLLLSSTVASYYAFDMSQINLWNHIEPFILFGTGSALFVAFNKLLPTRIVDIDSLINALVNGVFLFSLKLRAFHNGDLSRYLVTIIFFTLFVICFMFNCKLGTMP